MIDGITTYGSEDLLNEIKNKEPVFICTIGTTETSRIPGISGAGATPELTEYTPAADVELMVLGEVRCMDGIAQTVVDGVTTPTPAVLTKAAIEVADIPFVIVNAGSKIKPEIQCMNLTDDYGRDVRTGQAIKNPLEIFENARELGLKLTRMHDYLVIGESIAAGTNVEANTTVDIKVSTGPEKKTQKEEKEVPFNLNLTLPDDGSDISIRVERVQDGLVEVHYDEVYVADGRTIKIPLKGKLDAEFRLYYNGEHKETIAHPDK